MVVTFSCKEEDDMDEMMNEKPTLVEAAQDAGLTTLLSAVQAVDGLEASLTSSANITVFAPTNDAFADLLAAFEVDNLDALVAAIGGVENLETILGYHVIIDQASSADLSDGQDLTTLSGQSLTVNVSGETVTLTDVGGNTVAVVTADVEIENGYVHVIDGVLLPSIELPNNAPTLVEAANSAGLTTLLSAVGAVDGLEASLTSANEITVFAPTNDAFANALAAYGVDNLEQLIAELGGVDNLESVLGFHVVGATAFSTDLSAGDQTFTTLNGQDITVNVSGADVTVTDALGNTASVVTADVEIQNGVVHVIDAVLLPELTYPTVVDAATSAGLTTLLDAVSAASLGTTLLEAEAITVFAPTNDAFAGLLSRYEATDLNDLVSKIGLDAVTEVLQFHVVPAVAFSHDLEDGEQTFTTLQGQELTVTKNADGVFVTDYLGFTYQVAVADVAISNGVVHVIDGVVLPDLATNTPNVVEAATSAGLTTLIDAVVAAELDDDLLQATEITVFAPTNDAFADLLAAQQVNNLDELINKLGAATVANVLQFHVVPAVAFAQDLAEGDQELTTLSGEALLVNKTAGTVTITDKNANVYTVTTADVEIENGVVHVIDGVLLPTLN